MTDLGPCSYYLGIQILRDRLNRKIHLVQTAYIDKVLNTFNILRTQRKDALMEVSALNMLVLNLEQAATA